MVCRINDGFFYNNDYYSSLQISFDVMVGLHTIEMSATDSCEWGAEVCGWTILDLLLQVVIFSQTKQFSPEIADPVAYIFSYCI